ncbi:hypothetical protein McanCB56680_002428 [Microsporum canis]
MNTAVVKSLADCLTKAYRDAERLGNSQIDLDFFQNTHVTTCVVEFYRALPAGIRSATKTPRLNRNRRPITLAAQLLPFFEAWKVDPSSFFTLDSIHTGQCPLSKIYGILAQTEEHHKSDYVRLRLLYVVFSLIKEKFERCRLRGGTLDSYAATIQHSGIVHSTLEEVKTNLGIWASKGDKYKSLALELGGYGNLFLLPDTGSVWEHKTPKDGERRLERIEKLKEQGINTEAIRIGAHGVAQAIINYMVTQIPVQVAYHDTMQQLPSLSDRQLIFDSNTWAHDNDAERLPSVPQYFTSDTWAYNHSTEQLPSMYASDTWAYNHSTEQLPSMYASDTWAYNHSTEQLPSMYASDTWTYNHDTEQQPSINASTSWAYSHGTEQPSPMYASNAWAYGDITQQLPTSSIPAWAYSYQNPMVSV